MNMKEEREIIVKKKKATDNCRTSAGASSAAHVILHYPRLEAYAKARLLLHIHIS